MNSKNTSDKNQAKALNKTDVSSCVSGVNIFWCGFCKTSQSFRYIPPQYRGKYESKYSYGWECTCCKNRM
jgi:hypothetical protein